MRSTRTRATAGRATAVAWRHRQVVLRVGGSSVRVSHRALLATVTSVVAAAALAVFALGAGEFPVSPGEVISVLVGADDSFARVVVLEWRMPRIVGALLIGAALGMAGAIFQTLTRNPLGSPDIIGFNVGAYTGALVVIATVGRDYARTAVGALLGGLAVATVVYLLSRKRGSVHGVRLIVVGIAVSAVMSSVNQWIIVRIDLHAATSAAVWAQGTLNGLDWAQVVPLAICFALVTVLLGLIGPSLTVMQMGDDAAGALGLRTERVRASFFVLGVVLVALAAAAAGPISFVALAAPQIARRLTSSPGVGLTSSAVTGAVLLLASDLVALRALAPTELPVGAVTVCLGGAYLVFLLVTHGRRRAR